MNAPSLIQPSVSRRERLDLARRSANEWRGKVQDAFARAEAAVTECLLALALVPGRGKKVAVLRLVGQRYDALASALDNGGPFAAEAGNALATMAELRRWDDVRIALCHGVGETKLDAQRRWSLTLDVTDLKSGIASRHYITINEDHAERLWIALSRLVQRLSSQLSHLTTKAQAAKPSDS